MQPGEGEHTDHPGIHRFKPTIQMQMNVNGVEVNEGDTIVVNGDEYKVTQVADYIGADPSVEAEIIDTRGAYRALGTVNDEWVIGAHTQNMRAKSITPEKIEDIRVLGK